MPTYDKAELQGLSHQQLIEIVLELQAGKSDDIPETIEQPTIEQPTDEQDAIASQEMMEEDEDDPAQPNIPKLSRSISRVPTNSDLVKRLRAELSEAVDPIILHRQCSPPDSGEAAQKWEKITHANYFLPCLDNEEPECARYIYRCLTASEYQEPLEDQLVLNWAVGQDLSEEHKLHVLRTAADGNCLLHSALLAMIGLHDFEKVGSNGLGSIRAVMNRLFREPRHAEPIRKRWKVQVARDDAWQPEANSPTTGEYQLGQIEVSDEQRERDWLRMVDIAGRPNEFLDTVHVLALAHALRRPIIILANEMYEDAFGEPLTPIYHRGIYLPFERSSEECCRQPLLLCFRDSHYMPLVPLNMPGNSAPIRIPLVDGHKRQLPIRFALPEEVSRQWELVGTYLDIERDARFPKAEIVCNVALLQRTAPLPVLEDMLKQYVDLGRQRFYSMAAAAREKRLRMEEAAEGSPKKPKLESGNGTIPHNANGVSNASSSAKKLTLKSSMEEGEEPDSEQRVDKFQVTLPKGLQPGDQSSYTTPAKDCTEPQKFPFTIPETAYGGDQVWLTIRFRIKGHCIRAVKEVTGVSREDAVKLLTKAHGSADAAAEQYFSDMNPD